MTVIGSRQQFPLRPIRRILGLTRRTSPAVRIGLVRSQTIVQQQPINFARGSPRLPGPSHPVISLALRSNVLHGGLFIQLLPFTMCNSLFLLALLSIWQCRADDLYFISRTQLSMLLRSSVAAPLVRCICRQTTIQIYKFQSRSMQSRQGYLHSPSRSLTQFYSELFRNKCS